MAPTAENFLRWTRDQQDSVPYIQPTKSFCDIVPYGRSTTSPWNMSYQNCDSCAMTLRKVLATIQCGVDLHDNPRYQPNLPTTTSTSLRGPSPRTAADGTMVIQLGKVELGSRHPAHQWKSISPGGFMDDLKGGKKLRILILRIVNNYDDFITLICKLLYGVCTLLVYHTLPQALILQCHGGISAYEEFFKLFSWPWATWSASHLQCFLWVTALPRTRHMSHKFILEMGLLIQLLGWCKARFIATCSTEPQMQQHGWWTSPKAWQIPTAQLLSFAGPIAPRRYL